MFALHMGWRHLLFANWPVAPETVEARIPDALSVDTYDGRAWLSIVPYVNVDVRPRRLPRGTGFRLPELNLRTYVIPEKESDEDENENGPGVYFFSLDAGGLPGIGLAGVLGARLLHHLPYYYADVELSATDDRVRFESQRRHPGARPVRFSATYGPTATGGDSTDDPTPDDSTDGDLTTTADPTERSSRVERGSLAEFLTERYRYYTESPSGDLRYADIYHERWSLSAAEAEIRENALFCANGFDHPEGDPVCYYSPGLDVLASRSRRLEDSRA